MFEWIWDWFKVLLKKISSKLQSGAYLMRYSPFRGWLKFLIVIMYALSSGSFVFTTGRFVALPVKIWKTNGAMDLKSILQIKFTHFKSQNPCSIPSPCFIIQFTEGYKFSCEDRSSFLDKNSLTYPRTVSCIDPSSSNLKNTELLHFLRTWTPSDFNRAMFLSDKRFFDTMPAILHCNITWVKMKLSDFVTIWFKRVNSLWHDLHLVGYFVLIISCGSFRKNSHFTTGP